LEDRSQFIAHMEYHLEEAAFVGAMRGLGHDLGLIMTVEGVEEQTQATPLLLQGSE
jgi:EAL domain-containing protein (putative c-di-GMP-specific phosphodiesterase class I)